MTKRHCSKCNTEVAPLCDCQAARLRRDCNLVHVAIAAGARVGSGTIRNLRADEEKLKEYDERKEAKLAAWRKEYGENEEARAQIVATTHWHLHQECEEANANDQPK